MAKKKGPIDPNKAIIAEIFSEKKPVIDICGGYIKSVKREKYQLRQGGTGHERGIARILIAVHFNCAEN